MNYYVNPSLPFLTLTMNILNRNVIQNTVKHPIKKSFHKCLLNHHDSVMIDNKSKKITTLFMVQVYFLYILILNKYSSPLIERHREQESLLVGKCGSK